MSEKHYQLRVKNITRETAQAVSIEFEQPQEGKLGYKPGQFLTFLLKDDNGKEYRRAYSLCSAPIMGENPTVTVKEVEGGQASVWLNNNCQVGDSITSLEPMGIFTTDYHSGQSRQVVLFAGGSGITPMMSILKTLLKAEPNSRVLLVYASRRESEIIFQKQLDELSKTYGARLSVAHVLSQPSEAWQGYKGRLSEQTLGEILAKYPAKSGESREYFMCGPQGMMETIEAYFEANNLPKEQLHKESFGLSPEEAAARSSARLERIEQSGENPIKTVKVIYAGEEYVFQVPPDKTILETAQSLDIDLPYSCQSGMCTACMGLCTSGKVELDEEDALTPGELDQGYVLTCVGHPLSDNVVIEIE